MDLTISMERLAAKAHFNFDKSEASVLNNEDTHQRISKMLHSEDIDCNANILHVFDKA